MDQPTNTETQKPRDAAGWILILLSLGLIGYFILWPIWQVQHNAPEITFSGELGLAGILLFIIGIAKSIAPEATNALFKMDRQNLKAKDIVLLAIVAVFGIAAAVGFEYYFNSMGYH